MNPSIIEGSNKVRKSGTDILLSECDNKAVAPESILEKMGLLEPGMIDSYSGEITEALSLWKLHCYQSILLVCLRL